jgi:hypothetical protein
MSKYALTTPKLLIIFHPHFYFKGGTLLVTQLVEALRYKSESGMFESPWCHWNFSVT